jgi:hypothetical protein
MGFVEGTASAVPIKRRALLDNVEERHSGRAAQWKGGTVEERRFSAASRRPRICGL